MFNVRDIVKKSMDGEEISASEIRALFQVELFSEESAIIQAASYRKSKKASKGKAEVHAQVGINISPCPKDCLFCSFAATNRVFKDSFNFKFRNIIENIYQFEKEGANAIYVMATGNYPFEQFIEISQDIRKAINPEIKMIANVGDFSIEEGKKLKSCGYQGIYHAVRLGEGIDTKIKVERRLKTFVNARESGLLLGTCLEPVGSEHSLEELVEKTLITREANPIFSGAARRIPIPQTALSRHEIVSESRMAHILAVVRLAMGYDVAGNCTHEPNSIGCFAGANLLWAELGSNPRDTNKETKDIRGFNVEKCWNLFKEAEWEILKGPSKFYSKGIYSLT